MAGHSQFKNIMHRKGRQDAQKSKLFGKLAREITVAAKLGTPDPAMNPRLRAAVIAARQENMPKDNIERAIKKALGSDGENYDEIRYEGYGPGGVAVIVEALTDNRNRAASDIRSFFTKSGGNLGETGSVAFMFDRTGIIEYDRSVASDDAVLDAAIEAGADDVVSGEGGHEIYASTEGYRDVAKALEAKFGEPRKAALTWKPQNAIALHDAKGEQMLDLMSALEESDDVLVVGDDAVELFEQVEDDVGLPVRDGGTQLGEAVEHANAPDLVLHLPQRAGDVELSAPLVNFLLRVTVEGFRRNQARVDDYEHSQFFHRARCGVSP